MKTKYLRESHSINDLIPFLCYVGAFVVDLIMFFSDSNECATNNGGCSSVTTCVNTIGSFFCTCNVNYAGNNFSCSGRVKVCVSLSNKNVQKQGREVFLS